VKSWLVTGVDGTDRKPPVGWCKMRTAAYCQVPIISGMAPRLKKGRAGKGRGEGRGGEGAGTNYNAWGTTGSPNSVLVTK